MLFVKVRSIAARLALSLALLAGFAAALPARTAQAATLTVTHTGDSGPGSLRQAVASAAAGDTIKFAPALAGQTITLASTLTLSKSITIDGAGLEPRVEISGGDAVRIFLVDANAAISPAIKNVVLKQGKQTLLTYQYFGGALFVDSYANLTLERVLIANNSAYKAGAMYIAPYAVVTITDSEIQGNTAGAEGGAIFVQSIGILNLRDSLVSGNVSGGSGTIYFSGATNPSVIENNTFENNSALSGGAILGQLGNARVELYNNLFSGNHATSGSGGAVYFHASTIPTLVILENNTFYDNDATGSGGGAYLDAAAEYYLINNTLSANMAGSGGNLYLGHGAGASRMYNNILADHAGGGDCLAFFNSTITGSNNLIEDGFAECEPAFTGDPGLLPLADNGGPTRTMALAPDSVGIDAGNDTYCPARDPRGAPRPQGLGCDLGAVELDETFPTLAWSRPADGGALIADAPMPLQIAFEEPMNRHFVEGRVDDPSNYRLVHDSGDGFQTSSCQAGVSAQDQALSIDGVAYDEATFTASLSVNNGSPLPLGKYRLFACGTNPALKDIAGNLLNDGLSDIVIDLRVIGISDTDIAENEPAGTAVFTLTAPAGTTFSYGLAANITGCSGADNGLFSFSASQLRTTAALDYEAKVLYTICVTMTESGGPVSHQELEIHVTDVNEPPLDIMISKTTVSENSPAATVVGYLSTQDPDAGSSFTYSLVENVVGCSSADNGSFTIGGNALRTNAVVDYETKASYSVCIRSTDSGSLSIARPFTVTVLDTNDAPSNVLLTPSSIAENQPGNTLVGYLVAVDPDGPTTTTFSSIPGQAGCSASGFNWFVLTNGNEIRALAPLDYESASSFTLCIRATDSLGASVDREVTVTVTNVEDSTFADVSDTYWAWDFVERLYEAGITGGCGVNPLRYCPEGTVTRAQMAVFLLRGIHGSAYTPPAVGASTGFGDVPADHWAAAFIKQLAAEGITAGCGNGNYCPEGAVNRAQMAVFLLRAKYGSAYSPPGVGPGTGFGDVPADHWAAAFIKQLVAEGITVGCGGGSYCPEGPVTRAQMAVFLVRTFNLP